MQKTIKVIPRFLNKTNAKQEAAFQQKLAKEHGRIGVVVIIEDAYRFFVKNGWFKSNPFGIKGIPKPGDFLVVVYDYKEPQSVVKAVKRKVKIIELTHDEEKRNEKVSNAKTTWELKRERTLVVPFPVSIYALTYKENRRLAS